MKRFEERKEDLKKAANKLNEALIGDASDLEIDGILHRFEFTFELAWKTMKDYLEFEGYEVKSPRSTIQTAFQNQLITEGHIWIDALEKRNLMAHTYDEEVAKQAEKLIKSEYYPVIRKLLEKLEE